MSYSSKVDEYHKQVHGIEKKNYSKFGETSCSTEVIR
jgi:hypothetical protein